jgi:hypothetical protein
VLHVAALTAAPENRQQHVRRKAAHDFRAGAGVREPADVAFRIALAEAQLDNVVAQRRLLNELAAQGNLKGPGRSVKPR